LRILVDADSIVYTVGFASQTSDYDVHVFDADGELADRTQVQGLDELGALTSQLPEGYTLEHEPLVTESPLEHALGSTKKTLHSIEDALREHGIPLSTPLDLFLTGKGNYRDQYAKVRGYKANRKDAPRPVHYDAIREYLIRQWGATVVSGIEADDAVATIANTYDYDPEQVCIVSCDKDLTTVPGRLYNFRRRTMVVLSEAEARGNFYRQMITGDVTDNVMGVYKSGPKAAAGIVDDRETERSQAQKVLTEFDYSRSRKGCPYADRDARDVMTETGILLHMQRTPGEIWAIPEGV